MKMATKRGQRFFNLPWNEKILYKISTSVSRVLFISIKYEISMKICDIATQFTFNIFELS